MGQLSFLLGHFKGELQVFCTQSFYDS
jgi:hypothetical protein